MKIKTEEDISEFIEKDVRITCYDGDIVEGFLSMLDTYDDGEEDQFEPYICGGWTNVYPGLTLRGSEIEKIELLENCKD